MKILVVSNMFPDNENPSYGVFVKNFCDQLGDIGVQYKQVTMKKKNGKFKKILGYFTLYFNSFIQSLFHEYDIIYIHYASHSSCGVLLASKLKKLNIYTNLHGSDVIPENKKQEKMQIYTQKILSKSKSIVVPSEYFKNVIVDKYNVVSNIVHIYPSGGINTDIFHKSDNLTISKTKQEYHIDPNLFTFGMAGRISEKKGWDTFVDAIKIVLDRGYNANFAIIGDGPESNDLETKLKKLNLENKIYFKKSLISQDNLAKYYSMLDWFVFPTKREGESLGLVAVEAMACDTPVIASDFAAPKYYIENGVNGFKFEVDNPHALAESIIRVVDSKLDKEKFKEGLEKTVTPFKRENIKECLKKILVGDKTDEFVL